MEMGVKRRFRGKNKSGGRDPHRGIHSVYRYEDEFKNADAALALFKDVPFLNGGLFECLDKFTKDESDQLINVVRIDGFSDELHNTLKVPNKLFFSEAVDIDLNEIFATRNKRYTARGLLNSRPCKIRFSKSTLHGVTKNQFFDDHVSDPIARSRSPYAPSRII